MRKVLAPTKFQRFLTDDDVIVGADLPGLKPEEVDISITENTLTLKGEFRSEEKGKRGAVHFRERRSFARL